MAISLSKGGNVSLSKEAPGLQKIMVGLGWDARATDGKAFDLDASAFLLGEGDRVRSDADFIFYNQTEGGGGAVRHQGDNLTGAGEGDDEQIEVSLATLPPDVQKIAVSVTIHEAESRGQNFGMVSNAFIRVVNAADGQEIARYDLSEDASTETAMVFGEIYRHGAEFKFRAVGQGFAGGLAPLARNFGVSIG
jgi:tellurium resistance protein TerD